MNRVLKEVRKIIPERVFDLSGAIIVNNTLLFVDTLRDEPQLCEWAINDLGGMNKVSDVLNIWGRKVATENDTIFGKITLTSCQILSHKPITACDYKHILAFRSSDINLLKYIQFEVERRLAVRKQLANHVKFEDRKAQLKSLEKKDVDVYVKQLLEGIAVK